MIETIVHFLDAYKYYAYAVVFFGMLLEGAGVALVTSFFTQQGSFNFYAVFPVMFAGALLGSTLWYKLGHSFYGTKIGCWFRKRILKNEGFFNRMLRQKGARTLFMSKFVYGFDRTVVILAGLTKLDFRRFVKVEIAANAVWLTAIFSIGYYSGAALDRLNVYFKRAEIFLLIIIFLYVLAEIIVRKKIFHKAYGYLRQNNNNNYNGLNE